MARGSPGFALLSSLALVLGAPPAFARNPAPSALRGSVKTAPGEDDVDAESLADTQPDDAPGASIATLIQPAERAELELRPLVDEWVVVPRVELAVVSWGPWTLGAEVRSLNAVVEGSWATSSLILGPRLSLCVAPWHASVSFLPSISTPRARDVARHAPVSNEDDRSVARLLVGTRF
jgi:hypothetical protein